MTASLAEAAAGGEILFLQGPGKSPTAPGIEVFPDEASLLGALAADSRAPGPRRPDGMERHRLRFQDYHRALRG